MLQEVQVIYCGKCGMPPEYCEYGPDFESHCDPWLQKHHPDLRAKLASARSLAGSGKTKPSTTDENQPDPAGSAMASRPSAPWTTEQRLIEFYKKYQPDKLDSIPDLVTKYAGKEVKLFEALVKKYGPEPEDPYYADDNSDGNDDDDDNDNDDDDDEGLEEGMDNLAVGSKKRRGAKAKKAAAVETKILIQKVARSKKKTTTIVVGMETVEGLKLKDASKAFSKQFAGSSSVKDGPKGKEIILQGDHMDDVAQFIISKFNVPASKVFLDTEGEFIAYG